MESFQNDRKRKPFWFLFVILILLEYSYRIYSQCNKTVVVVILIILECRYNVKYVINKSKNAKKKFGQF
jgi:hypothetical protein